jgi:hypothetical protein
LSNSDGSLKPDLSKMSTEELLTRLEAIKKIEGS